MTPAPRDELEPGPNYADELRSYLTGYALAVILTLAAFAVVAFSDLPATLGLSVIGVLAVAQVVVHFSYFLHIDLSRQKREDLQVFLFSALLLAIMALGTIWIMANLATRMHGA